MVSWHARTTAHFVAAIGQFEDENPLFAQADLIALDLDEQEELAALHDDPPGGAAPKEPTQGSYERLMRGFGGGMKG